MRQIRMFIVATTIAAGAVMASVAAEASPIVADAVPVVEVADEAEARLINCRAWTSGRQAYAQCSGVNTLQAPHGNQVVVSAICVRPSWLGGGSYQAVGDWVGRNTPSILTCATFYNATQPTYWLR